MGACTCLHKPKLIPNEADMFSCTAKAMSVLFLKHFPCKEHSKSKKSSPQLALEIFPLTSALPIQHSRTPAFKGVSSRDPFIASAPLVPSLHGAATDSDPLSARSSTAPNGSQQWSSPAGQVIKLDTSQLTHLSASTHVARSRHAPVPTLRCCLHII